MQTRVLRAVAGPVLIVAAVIVVLHGLAFQSKVPSQHPDILGFWLPTYCFLGKSLAAGHIPAWNPHVMGGLPFAADPQSGWMYLPAMLLFGALPCGAAIGLMIVLQPALGGVGLYGFLRTEGLSRAAATTGGLALALGLAGSRLTLFLPFPSAFAWTAVLLWACASCMKARTWPARVGLAGVAAVVWGQLAAAYFAHGVILGTAAVAVYLAAKGWQAARGGTRSGRESLALAGLLAVAFVGVNLAFMLPRLAYAPETSYGQVLAGQAQLGPAPGPAWPLKLAVAPGGYLGVVAMMLSIAAFWSRRHSPLALAFAAFGFVSYLLGVEAVAAALARAVDGIPVLNFFAHFPARFSLGLLLALPVLAAIGVQAWTEPRTSRDRLLMAAPGAVLFVGLPAALGAGWTRLIIPAAGIAAGGLALVAVARRAQVAVLIPAVLAIELTVNGLVGQTSGALGAERAYADDLFETASTAWLVPLAAPDVDLDPYLRPGPIVRALRDPTGRYMSLAPAEATARGYLTLQDPIYWGLMANQRAMLFGLEDAQGYNPVQLARYWRYVRATSGGPIAYNASFYRRRPRRGAMDLLQVEHVVSAEGGAPEGWSGGTGEGRWLVYRSPDPPPLSSVHTQWLVVEDLEASLRTVTAPDFDPNAAVVLEEEPVASGPATPIRSLVRVPQRPANPQREIVVAHAPSRAVVLIRIPYARNWHASVDGRPAHILPANHFLMGVPVQAGTHIIGLTYHDPWIGYGLLGSALAVLALLVLALVVWRAGAARRSADTRRPNLSGARSG